MNSKRKRPEIKTERNDRLIREVDEALTMCEREVRKLLAERESDEG